MQAGLTHAWTTRIPLLQASSPATIVANILRRELETSSTSASSYTYIDFCAGAGGPTPYIERALNQQLRDKSPSPPPPTSTSRSYAAVAQAPPNGSSTTTTHPPPNSTADEGVKFVLTDLHPHVDSWEKAARASPYLTYVSTPVNAASAPPELITQHKRAGKGVFRLFNLAFHHFDDELARAILKNTVETSDGFG